MSTVVEHSSPFLFFGPNLEINSLPRSVTLNSSKQEWCCRAGACLLGPHFGPPQRRHFTHRQAAQSLLSIGNSQIFALNDAEQSRRHSIARELRDRVENTWESISRSEAVRIYLKQQLVKLNCPDPDETAGAALAGILEELLPGLRIRSFLLQCTTNSQHAHSLLPSFRDWPVSQHTASGSTALLSLLLTQMAQKAVEIDVTPFLIKLIPYQDSESLVTDNLLDDYAGYERALILYRLDQNSVTAPWLRNMLNRADNVAKETPPNLSIMELQSLIYLILGAEASRNVFGLPESSDNFVKSFYFDPGNEAALYHVQELYKLSEDQESQLNGVSLSQLTPESRIKVDCVREALNKIEYFRQSETARQIQERREQALERELPRRLGLTCSPEDIESASRFAEFVAHRSGEDGFPGHARQIALEHEESWATLRWSEINNALTHSPIEKPEHLTLLLSAPERGRSEWLNKVLETVSSPSSTYPCPIPVSRLQRWGWMYSGRDRLWKLAAAAGLILIVWAGYAEAKYRIRERQKQREYDEVIASARDLNDAETFSNAIDFLSIAESPADEQRIEQVRTLLDETWIRESLRIHQDGTPQDFEELLARYEAVAKE